MQGALQNLVSYGLANRSAVKRKRGRAYEYSAVPKRDAKKITKNALQEWSKAVEKAIEAWQC